MITINPAEVLAFATAAIARYRAIDAAERPKDRQVAGAEFRGVCIAADRLGLANTPDHFHMVVMDVIREAGDRPPYMAANNKVQQRFDREVARTLAEQIEEMAS